MAGDHICLKRETYASDKLNVLGDFTLNGTATGITSEMVGLGNVSNTSDTNKPISTATRTALNAYMLNVNPSWNGVLNSGKFNYLGF